MSRPFSFAILLLLGASCSSAPCPAPDAELASRARKLVELSLAEGRAYEMLAELVRVAPNRLSGSEGAARAVAWAQDTMRYLGLDNVRLEEVVVPRWVRGEVQSLEILSPPEARGEELRILALGGSVATPEEGITAEVVEVRGLEEARALGEKGKGKIVFFNRPMPRALANTFQAYGGAVDQRGGGAVEAARVGGVAAIVRSMTTRIDDSPHTGAMHYEDGVAKVPAAAVSTKGAERLTALLKSGKEVRVRLRLSCRTLDDVTSANVVGEIAGSGLPDEVVLVGGHLDAWDAGQGAHDDGAGCVHSIEALRLIRAAGIVPRRTIRAVLFMNEENGLSGGLTYARDHARELPLHVAAIESDRGGFEPKGFSTSAKGEELERQRRLASFLDPWSMGALVPGRGGADIRPLAEAGVTVMDLVTASQRYFDFHHSELDRIEHVNERELQLGAAALAFMLSAIADQ